MDPISRRLDEAANGVVPYLGPAVAVRARGEHRRRAVRRGIVGGAALSTALIVVTGVALGGTRADDPPRSGLVASPPTLATGSPSASATESPSPRPSRSLRRSRPALPPVSLPPPGPSEVPPVTPAPVTELPDGFAFAEEQSRQWVLWPDEFKVTRTDDVRTEWALDPCKPTTYPTDQLRTDFYEARRDGPEWLEIRQVGVYPSEADAYEVMAGFRRVLTACAEHSSDPKSLARHSTTEVKLGDDGLQVFATYFYSGNQGSGGTLTTAVRVGNAVVMAVRDGEFGAGSPQIVARVKALNLRAAARAVEALCNFNASCG